jgi:hypothetical protein
MCFERRIGCDPPILTEMEGSMKMMSWSRYHCLSWALLHAARQQRRAARIRRIRHRHLGVTGERARWRWWSGVSRPICFQFVIRMLRTETRSGGTDI